MNSNGQVDSNVNTTLSYAYSDIPEILFHYLA